MSIVSFQHLVLFTSLINLWWGHNAAIQGYKDVLQKVCQWVVEDFSHVNIKLQTSADQIHCRIVGTSFSFLVFFFSALRLSVPSSLFLSLLQLSLSPLQTLSLPFSLPSYLQVHSQLYLLFIVCHLLSLFSLPHFFSFPDHLHLSVQVYLPLPSFQHSLLYF